MSDDAYPDDPTTIDPADPVVATTGRAPGPSGSSAAGFERVMAQRQAAIATARTSLDRTIGELRSRHDGAGRGQMNLPLLALASGLLGGARGNKPPGYASNFGEELGAGLGAMGPVIANQRMNDTTFLKGVADLQSKQFQLEDVPLKDAAHAYSAANVADIRGKSAAEIAALRANRPLVDPTRGVTIYPNHFGPGRHGEQSGSSKGIVEVGAPDAARAPTQDAPTTPEEDVAFLQKNVHPDIKPGGFARGDINFAELAKVAREDPAAASELWKILNYDLSVKDITSQRNSKTQSRDLYKQLNAIDKNFTPGNYEAVKKAREVWGSGKNATNVEQLSKTVSHLADAASVTAALDNKDPQIQNVIKNKIAEWGGGSAPTTAKTVADILAKELAKYLSGPGGSSGVEERRDLEKLLSVARSPAQLQDAIRAAQKLIAGQAQASAANKTNAFGNGKVYTMDDLLTHEAKDDWKFVKSNDGTTPEGRAALAARLPPPSGRVQGAAARPAAPPEAVARLKANPGERALFEKTFGPGSASSVLDK